MTDREESGADSGGATGPTRRRSFARLGGSPNSSSIRRRAKSSGVVKKLKDFKGKHSWIPSPLEAAARWLTPTYQTKNDDFLKLFRQLPPGAMLIDDYSCALQRDILAHGRLYLSQRHLCFYANIFGWETMLVVPCVRITAITCERTAHVIPNALQICVNPQRCPEDDELEERDDSSKGSLGLSKDKFWFTSFVSRDTSYTILMKVWQNVLMDNPMSPFQLRHFALRCWGEKPDVVLGELVSDVASGPSAEGPTSDDDVGDGSGDDANPPVVEFLGDKGICSVAVEDDEDLVECGCLEHLESYIDQTFECSVDKLFELLFTDSQFFRNFCRDHKTLDLCMQEWTPTNGDGQRREVTYTLSLNKTMGPKFSPTTETQHCIEESHAGRLYKVDVEVANSGIPYGDVFYTAHRYCLTRVGPHRSRLHTGGTIRYRKSCWGIVKSFIERNCLEGMSSYYNDIRQGLEDECRALALQQLPTATVPTARRVTPSPCTEAVPTVPAEGTDTVSTSLPAKSTNLSLQSRVSSSRHSLHRTVSSKWPFLPSPPSNLLLLVIIVLLAVNLVVVWHLFSFLPLNLPLPQVLHELHGVHGDVSVVDLLKRESSLHRAELRKWQESSQYSTEAVLEILTLLDRVIAKHLEETKSKAYPPSPEQRTTPA